MVDRVIGKPATCTNCGYKWPVTEDDDLQEAPFGRGYGETPPVTATCPKCGGRAKIRTI